MESLVADLFRPKMQKADLKEKVKQSIWYTKKAYKLTLHVSNVKALKSQE